MRKGIPLRVASMALLLFLGSSVRAGDAPTAADLAGEHLPPDALWLESLDLGSVEQEWGAAQAARSVDGNPLRIAGRTFAHGVGSHANAEATIALGGVARRFVAAVGVDDEVGTHGSVAFVVLVDDEEAARTPVLRGGEAPRVLDVPLEGATSMTLLVEDGGDHIHYDHADWGGARILLAPGATKRPAMAKPPEVPIPPIVFPPPVAPEIHAPRITGATPGRPFLFRIPAAGQGPLRFEAAPLPEGVHLDPDTGILSGRLAGAGTTEVTVTVTGPKGRATSTLTIVGGEHRLALTPPMGWNSWNVWGTAVDQAKVEAAADAMEASGLAAYGYAYVAIDDAWEAGRDADGNILTNEKFPDMKALADHVHARGLKLGIYSSPGPKTCAGYEGSYGHEHQDARTWAAWGIDLVKYDWCSYGRIAKDSSREELMKPYVLMREALDACDRDIVYSLCQYGMGDVWTWGADVGGNYWRTTGDIRDSWSSMSGIGFGQAGKESSAGPGRWNDPDMLVVGKVGWGPTLHDSGLTPDEQITHITLWSLLAAPLLIGCDMTRMDPFTVAVLTNPEVLEVNQDPLGRQAARVSQAGRTEIWARPLADGTRAVGLFNRGRKPCDVTLRFSDLGLEGPQPVRDLWRRRDVGVHDDAWTTTVPRHGAVMLVVGD